MSSIEADILRVEEGECLYCKTSGYTRVYKAKLPYYRDIILNSFYCDKCGFKSNEVEPSNTIAEKACKWTLKVNSGDAETLKKELSRKFVSTRTSSMEVVDLGFEIPSGSRRTGTFNSIEGVLTTAAYNLRSNLNQQSGESKNIIEGVINNLLKMLNGEMGFTIVINDISGNSWVESFTAPNPDPCLTVTHYARTKAEDKSLDIDRKEIEDRLSMPDPQLEFEARMAEFHRAREAYRAEQAKKEAEEAAKAGTDAAAPTTASTETTETTASSEVASETSSSVTSPDEVNNILQQISNVQNKQ